MNTDHFIPTSVEGLSIRDLIDQRAKSTPHKVFLIDPVAGVSLNYAQLKNSCSAFAEHLVEDGLNKGDSVAYAMANGAEVVQVILGCLYGGFLATAINLVSGKTTIAHVLNHSCAKKVFVQLKTLALVTDALAMANSNAEIVKTDETWFKKGNHPISECRSVSDGLLMYTSGTTGVPKGVVHTHASLLAGGSNTALAHQLSANDRGLCILPLYHINGFCVSLMGALVSGGSLVMPDRFSVSTFWHLLREFQCSWFSLVPTQISYLLHEAETNGHDSFGLDQLRFGRSASAPLSPDIQQLFELRFKLPIIETMGLTETAAQILSNPINGVRKIGSPGIAFGNEIMIADESMQQVAPNKEGELLVRGPNIMREYRNDEAATRSSLTVDGWLRTGDLGRMDEDGYVFITGRLKELIIKGGENIAPREIDEALYTHPDVIEAAAFARDCKQYGQKVEAGVMVRAGSKLTAETLIKLCRDKVGTFKSPDQIHFLPELPKGPSGKIQRSKLAELTQQETL
jgi:acyl-CoA synthetase (AMP-forming)/AMP-acid ligase II